MIITRPIRSIGQRHTDHVSSFVIFHFLYSKTIFSYTQFTICTIKSNLYLVSPFIIINPTECTSLLADTELPIIVQIAFLFYIPILIYFSDTNRPSSFVQHRFTVQSEIFCPLHLSRYRIITILTFGNSGPITLITIVYSQITHHCNLSQTITLILKTCNPVCICNRLIPVILSKK